MSKFDDLMYEAGLTAQGCLDDYDQAALQRFAESIVQNCIRIIHEQERIPKEFFYAKGANQHELAIKSYFGMEI